MWQDQFNEPIEDLYEELREIADNHRELFAPDDLIDDCYNPVKIFGSYFSASTILKGLDPETYQDVWDEEMNRWAEDQLYEIEHVKPQNNQTLANFLSINSIPELYKITWKE